jgi:NitT/TauT family transport system substrate-binding protein
MEEDQRKPDMKTPTRKFIGLVIGLSLALALAACAPAATPTPALIPITVQLRWMHNAQFAGMYAADQKGYYTAEGLTVHFREGGPDVDWQKAVLEGAAQFGVHGADVLIAARAANKPLRAIAVIYRRSPVVFVALADSGITRPQDFVGKVIATGSGTGRLVLHLMTARVGVQPDQYTEVPLMTDLKPIYTGQVDILSGYLFDQPETIRRDGYQMNLIYPDDYGVHFYADTLFASDDLIAQNPDLVRRFLRATLKGWTYAVEHPAEVGAMVVKYQPDGNAGLENAKMVASLPLVNTGEDFIGWMKPEIWAGMEQTLREQGVLAAPLDVTQAYTLRFVEEIYE